jgi:streptomycin 6-kinase
LGHSRPRRPRWDPTSPELPSSLGWLRQSRTGRAWLDRLPRLVAECADLWSLSVEEPFPYAYTSLALRATLPDGGGAVLKIQFPHRESEHEAAALALWDGDGAVRLLAHDGARHALLLERCEPGRPLFELEEDRALDVMAGLLPRLWKPAGPPFRPLSEEAPGGPSISKRTGTVGEGHSRES